MPDLTPVSQTPAHEMIVVTRATSSAPSFPVDSFTHCRKDRRLPRLLHPQSSCLSVLSGENVEFRTVRSAGASCYRRRLLQKDLVAVWFFWRRPKPLYVNVSLLLPPAAGFEPVKLECPLIVVVEEVEIIFEYTIVRSAISSSVNIP